jgi:hypothetical protein
MTTLQRLKKYLPASPEKRAALLLAGLLVFTLLYQLDGEHGPQPYARFHSVIFAIGLLFLASVTLWKFVKDQMTTSLLLLTLSVLLMLGIAQVYFVMAMNDLMTRLLANANQASQRLFLTMVAVCSNYLLFRLTLMSAEILNG